MKNHPQLVIVEGRNMQCARRLHQTYLMTPDGKKAYQILERPYKASAKKFDKKLLNAEVEKIIKEIEKDIE